MSMTQSSLPAIDERIRVLENENHQLRTLLQKSLPPLKNERTQCVTNVSHNNGLDDVVSNSVDQVTVNLSSLHVQSSIDNHDDRLGVESLTHAPLSLRVFPPTELRLSEFETQNGKSLGKGAMGNVTLVRWITQPEQPLRALKRVSKFQIWKEDDPIMIFEQLWDEVQSLMTLSHPNIVSLDGYFEDYRYVYLVLEYAPNGDLNQRLGETTRFPELDVKRHLRCLIQALIHCHEHNFLHRDVKPENLLLSKTGDLLLADFGCVATKHSSRRSVVGTRQYHSWEIAADMAHDEASDAWSVGCVAFEFLTGKNPFESDDESEDESEENSNINSDEESCEDSHNDDEEDNHLKQGDECDSIVKDSDSADTDEISDTHSMSDCDERSDNKDSEDEYEEDDESGEEERDDNEDSDDDEEAEHEDDGDTDVNDSASDTDETVSSDSESEEEVKKIYSRIRELDFKFPDYVNGVARDFINKLFEKDKEARMTLTEALKHPFLQEV